MKTINTDNIFWLGHDSFRFSGSKTIYFDPWEVSGPQADIILITHEHFDHCDPETVRALSRPDTRIITESSAAVKLKDGDIENVITILDPDDEIDIMGVKIKTVASYNIGKDFHPKNRANLGFVVTMDGISVYHAGDTDFIPEMKDIKTNVALLPVSGTYTMNAEEAVRAALTIKPDVAIPMHYGKIVGDEEMARMFAERLQGQVPVEIKKISA